MSRARDDAAQACVALGFIGEGDDPQPMLDMLDLIFDPVYEDREYDPHDYNTVERAMKIATISLEKRVFKSPGHSVFLMRALVGLDSYIQQFGTVANFHRLFLECIEDAERRTAARPSRRSAQARER